jgi:hypothetical protein
METLGCECGRLDDLAVVPMGHHDEVFRTLHLVRKRGMPQWWLGACTCSACGQTWLVAQEERQNDIFILRRLDTATARRLLGDGVWPPDFDRFERLLEIGRAAGHSVRFADVADSTLLHTVADLARERPGIRVSELASLLNLDPAVAAELARQVVSGQPCVCFVCRPGRVVAEPGSVTVAFDAG